MNHQSTQSQSGQKGYGRPPILSAIAPLSIVVASLALVGGLLGYGCSWTTMNVVGESNNRARSYVQRVLEAQSATKPSESAEEFQVRLAASARRATVVDTLAQLQSLPGAGKSHLDLLLARHGTDILPPSIRHADDATATMLSSLVRDSGRDDQRTWFVLPTGKLIITSEAAMFAPAVGGGVLSETATGSDGIIAAHLDPFSKPEEVKRISGAGDDVEKVLTDPPMMRHASGLSTAQINNVVWQVDKLISGSMTLAQKQTLATELQTTSPPLVPPEQAYSAVRLADRDSDGTVHVYLVSGALTIGPTGRVVGHMGTSIETVTIAPMAVTLVVADTVIGLILAVLLLMAAILLIRRSRWSIAAHRLYALLKIPAVVMGFVGYRWVQTDFDAGFARLNKAGAKLEVFETFWQVLLCLGGIYAVVLLIVLASKPVRNYERSPGD